VHAHGRRGPPSVLGRGAKRVYDRRARRRAAASVTYEIELPVFMRAARHGRGHSPGVGRGSVAGTGHTRLLR